MPQLKTPSCFDDSPILARAGIGLKSIHYQEILDARPDIGWFEVHPENFMGSGGPPHRYLEAIRSHYPLSLHSVGLSLGSTDPINDEHLEKLRELIVRYEPHFVSDHLSWTSVGGVYFNDLLPIPYTDDSLTHIINRVDQVQNFLQRQILIENPSTYLTINNSDIPEANFLCEIAKCSGCEILLDVNNVYVSAQNNGFDARAYLAAISGDAVGEIHLAGHSKLSIEGEILLVDDHGSQVIPEVWKLYEDVVARIGRRPTLIEWDTNIPSLELWLSEAATADACAQRANTKNGAHADAA